ncbi:hypothetical protein SAMN05660464_4380 [Geodermatophilus dictyosporus]|uniref:Uncharacterized protein n=1 Tax=Geodermatophilus dictyosporus TaxID=1523247 RepID=A0A1I5TLL1_9ACTN|nr:hypothetical protein [Geodermatophilus dictyosporus]SFP83517.1 hypothetical protein SAMN05660464_4380 [Geodermatophilus dictyosporus]
MRNGQASSADLWNRSHRDPSSLSSWKVVLVALIAGGLVLALTLLASAFFDEPVAVFTRDGPALADLPWYTGSVSQLNAMVWATVAGLAVLVAWLEPGERARLGTLAAFVLALAADDALQLHEAVGPDNGVPQKAFLLVYAVTAALLLVLFLRGGRRGPTTALLCGGALLAVSVLFDQVVHRQILIAEDGAKLLGAIVWLTVPVLSVSRPARRDRRPPEEDGSAGLGPDVVRPPVDRSPLDRKHQQV